MTAIGPVLRYPGSKWTLARWIAGQLPRHTTYVEPFFGTGAVFFTKEPSRVEIVNDRDGSVVNLFRVLRERPEALAAAVTFTPWAREEYNAAYEPPTGDALEDARRFVVRCWQAHGTRIHQTRGRTGWRNDVQGRRGTSTTLLWDRLPERIVVAARRLKEAQIDCRPALDLLARVAYPEVAIYADPPYPLATRTDALYRHEMSDAEHLALLDALDRHPGPVLLSGYRCALYDERLGAWSRTERAAWADGGRERTEALWLNPEATQRLAGGLPLFTKGAADA